MRWGSDDIGVVLTRNEIWLLLHALAEAKTPAVDWEGNRVEPWVVGELRSRLQSALRPEPLSDIEERPIIRLDSEMGRSLAQAGVRPLVLSDGYDLGSLVAACAERGWGVDVRLPVGAGPVTPAEAVVTVGTGHSALGTGQSFVGLERPVVALARAMLGAAEDGDTGNRQWAMGNRDSPSAFERLTPNSGLRIPDSGPSAPDRGREEVLEQYPNSGLRTPNSGPSSPDPGRGEVPEQHPYFELRTPDPGPSAPDPGREEVLEQHPNSGLRTPDSGPSAPNRGRVEAVDPDVYLVPAAAINAGERDALLRQMTGQGWELVGEDATGVRFRRASEP